MTILAERDLVANEPVLLEESPHLHVGEPQVMPRDDGVGLLYATGVEEVAAAGAGYGLLAGAVLTEARVLGLSVGADGRERDPG